MKRQSFGSDEPMTPREVMRDLATAQRDLRRWQKKLEVLRKKVKQAEGIEQSLKTAIEIGFAEAERAANRRK